MSFLEKWNRRLVHLMFPFVERIFLFVPFVMLVAVWSIPETYWPIRVVLVWIWLICNEIHWEGTAERDCLPLQPGSGLFYRIYRVVDETAFLFLLICLVIMLIPGPPWFKFDVVMGVFLLTVILRSIGDRKYRPRKPEES